MHVTRRCMCVDCLGACARWADVTNAFWKRCCHAMSSGMAHFVEVVLHAWLFSLWFSWRTHESSVSAAFFYMISLKAWNQALGQSLCVLAALDLITTRKGRDTNLTISNVAIFYLIKQFPSRSSRQTMQPVGFVSCLALALASRACPDTLRHIHLTIKSKSRGRKALGSASAERIVFESTLICTARFVERILRVHNAQWHTSLTTQKHGPGTQVPKFRFWCMQSYE